MFMFFKRRKKFNNKIFLKICGSLPAKYLYLYDQVKDNIILSVNKADNGYYKFNLDCNLFDKYEQKRGRYYQINGIMLSDMQIQMTISLRVGYGILLGYLTPNNVLLNSLNDNVNVDVSNIEIEFFDEIEKDIINLLSKEEHKYITPNDIYEIELKDYTLYHLYDIGDGDFIAIDKNKKIYKVTHDPLEIEVLSENLLDILKKQ